MDNLRLLRHYHNLPLLKQKWYGLLSKNVLYLTPIKAKSLKLFFSKRSFK